MAVFRILLAGKVVETVATNVENKGYQFSLELEDDFFKLSITCLDEDFIHIRTFVFNVINGEFEKIRRDNNF